MSKWFRIYYNKMIGSIAFIPAIIAIGFLLLSWGMIEIDFSPWGKHFKSGLSWVSLKDASTARTIVSTVAGALISLTVFSFSLVMIVLNQAASQMSNRVLTSMIENRFQQIVLGFYIGTIVYALFLLSTIRDVDSGIYVPALSIYLLILLTVVDIFLFIYFLNYVTQTVKYETVIHRVQEQTMATMKKKFCDIKDETVSWSQMPCREIRTDESNYFQNFNEKRLLKIATEKNLFIHFLYTQATYLIKGTVFMKVYSSEEIDDNCISELLSSIDFFKGQPIETNADYGFSQLAEVAIKALSPGINDPATAVLTVHALSDLFSYKLYHNLPEVTKDAEGVKRIFKPVSTFTDMFEKCIDPIWNYGKSDQYIQNVLVMMARQLKAVDVKQLHTPMFDELIGKVNAQRQTNHPVS